MSKKLKDFIDYISEKKSAEGPKGKFNKMIKELESCNEKDNEYVKSAIAALKRARDLGEHVELASLISKKLEENLDNVIPTLEKIFEE